MTTKRNVANSFKQLIMIPVSTPCKSHQYPVTRIWAINFKSLKASLTGLNKGLYVSGHRVKCPGLGLNALASPSTGV